MKLGRKNLLLILQIILITTLTSCNSGGTVGSNNGATSDVSTGNRGPSFNIRLVQKSLSNQNLPTLQGPIIAPFQNQLLILGGSTGAFHAFNSINPNLSVYDLGSKQLYSIKLSATALPGSVIKQLESIDSQWLIDGNTLYIIGGYHVDEQSNYTTLNTITSINVPTIITGILQNNGSIINSAVNFNNTIPQFQVTGGQLGKIGNYFYLVFGQDCEGLYCSIKQTYTNSIYKFTATPELNSLKIVESITHESHDNSGFRRRDYNLVPILQKSFTSGNTTNEILLAMGGPFTQSQNNPLVWDNAITFNEKLDYNQNFITQQANQYADGFLSMYSQNSATSYIATFSGLSNMYWSNNSTTKNLISDNTTPYGNIMGLISIPAKSSKQEFANKMPICLEYSSSAPCDFYMGLGAVFIPTGNYYDNHSILQLDTLTNDDTMVGYLYGGIISESNTIFVPGPLPQNGVRAANIIYEVHIDKNIQNSNEFWQNLNNGNK